MTKPTYDYIESPHRTRVRVKPISAIVIHYTGSMSIESTISWFLRPESKVSAHYVVGREGRVVQMVMDDQVAWHAGRSAMRPTLPDTDPRKEVNVNKFSLGIELVGDADSGFTDRQLASLYELIAVLVQRYKIPPERVVGHSTVSPGRKIDPEGFTDQFPWAKTKAVATLAFQATTGVNSHT